MTIIYDFMFDLGSVQSRYEFDTKAECGTIDLLRISPHYCKRQKTGIVIIP